MRTLDAPRGRHAFRSVSISTEPISHDRTGIVTILDPHRVWKGSVRFPETFRIRIQQRPHGKEPRAVRHPRSLVIHDAGQQAVFDRSMEWTGEDVWCSGCGMFLEPLQ